MKDKNNPTGRALSPSEASIISDTLNNPRSARTIKERVLPPSEVSKIADTLNAQTRAREIADTLAVKKAELRQLYVGVLKFQLAWIFGGITTCLFADTSLMFAGFSGVAAIIGSYGYMYFAMGITKVETEVFAVPTNSTAQPN